MIERSSIDFLRLLVKAFNGCSEDFNQQFTVEELIQIRRMWLQSGWDIYPDKWEAFQVMEALEGKVPRWDDNERAIG